MKALGKIKTSFPEIKERFHLLVNNYKYGL